MNKTVKEVKIDSLQKDKDRANELITAYSRLKADEKKITEELEKQLEPFKTDYENKTKFMRDLSVGKLSSISASITEAEKELLEIGVRQRKKMFDAGNNWNFDNGWYIHVNQKTEPKFGENFSLAKFIKKFGQFVKIEYKIKELKALFTDGDKRTKSKIDTYDFDLQVKDTSMEIKQKAAETKI